MADDVTKRLIWQFSSTGADKVAADLGQVNAEQAKLAASSQTVTKSSLDLEKSFDNLERRFDSTIRAQQDYEKVQQKVNAAVAQHPELQERANNVLALAKDKFDAAKGATDAYSKAVDAARGAALGLAAGIGPLGAVLGSFGPWGVAAAAGIGLVSNALAYMKENADKLGDVSASLNKFANSTGLTTTQIRGLSNAGSEVGVSNEAVGASLQKFILGLDEARKGGGDLYDQLRLIDKQLAEDISFTRDSAEALDILSKAYNSTNDAVTKARISRAAFGKDVSVGGLLGVIGDAGGVDSYSKSVERALGVTDDWTKKVAELRTENKNLEEDLKTIEGSWYTKEMLERQNQALKTQIEIAKAIAAAMAKQGGTPLFGDPEAAGGAIPIRTPASDAANAPAASFADRFSALPAAASAATNQIAEATTTIRKNWQDILDAMQRQLPVSEAVGGAARMSAQYGKDYADAMQKGATATEAAAVAAAKLQDSQAQVNAAAKETLFSLQNTAGVAGAVTGEQQIQAQHQATYNKLLHDGVDASVASAVAAKEEANARARATAAVLSQVEAMKDSTTMIDAQTADLGTGAHNAEMMAAAGVAYKNAIQSGADASAAAALSSATIANYMAKAAQDAAKLDIALVDAYNAQVKADMEAAMKGGTFGPGADRAFASDSATPGKQYTSTSNTGLVMQEVYNQTKSTSDLILAATASGNIDSAINQLKTARATTGYGYVPEFNSNVNNVFSDFGLKDKGTQDDITNAFLSLYDTKRAQGGDASAITKQEIADLQAMPQNQTTLDAIANLTKSLNDVTSSTDSLTKSNEDLLSPYYTTDPRTSHIGFRSQGMAAGGYVDVPGGYSANDNMVAAIPVASGERIYVDPMASRRGGGGGQSVTINVPIVIQGNANKDDVGRSVYQNAQVAARQISMAGR